MPFPERKRIIYKKNPLERVICQLRFPPILKIETEIPSAFQDKIRKDFPNFLEKSEMQVELPIGIPGQSTEVPGKIVQSVSKNMEFSSEDDSWKINLTRSFIALSALRYLRWESFKEKLSVPLEAFLGVYSPENYSRLGLRYIDIIKRSDLGLDGVGWDELLQPYILGILSTKEVGARVEGYESKNEIKLEDGTSSVRIVTKLIESDSGEICFLIDSDFFTTQKIAIHDAIAKLDYFNTRGSRLIQWCITDRLHTAMEPAQL
ncbi:MAG: TIGR04255 family protein [Chloroflexota bacterium]